MSGHENKRVMAVFAHPDDEAFGVGGTLAALAAGGAEVTLLCATRGEVGEISDPSLATPETLPAVREEELRCSCEKLGIQPPIFLGYRDSGMIGTADNEHPDSLAVADVDEVAGRIVRHIRRVQPEVLFTFEAGGGDGNLDHIVVHKATTRAYRRSGDPSCYPEQLEELRPHSPEKLLYAAIPRSGIRTMVRKMTEAGGDVSAFENMDLETIGVPDEEIDILVDVGDKLDAKLQAITCHATQVRDGGPWLKLPEADLREVMGREYFIQAEPQPARRLEGGVEVLWDE